MTSTCASIPAASATASGTSYLARPTPSSFVTRNGSRLSLDGADFKIAGPNVYWLGLDENVGPSPSIPAKDRVLEAMAVASVMGASVVRSTTLGVSVGDPASVEPSLGVFNETALQAIDYAVYAARRYGLRLIIPLTDQYDYYHGGHLTFLRWRNVSHDQSAFYDVSSTVFSDFSLYISTLLNHTSNYTSLALKDDPTILAWETGNELSSPPTAWTSAVASLIRSLSPHQLISSGRYGVSSSDLSLASIDMVTNHFYPPSASRYASDAAKASKAGKVYFAGEFDWTGRTRDWQNFLWCAAPLLLSVAAAFMPRKWFPRAVPLPWRSRRDRDRKAAAAATDYVPLSPIQDDRSPASTPAPDPAKAFAASQPPAPGAPPPPRAVFLLRKWHVVAFALAWVPLSAVIVYFAAPTGLDSFLEEASSNGEGAGTLYWSLFGRDGACCNFVEHNDGFTLHYPGTSESMRRAVLKLTRHAYSLTRGSAPFLSGLSNLNDLDEADLPAVACPQTS